MSCRMLLLIAVAVVPFTGCSSLPMLPAASVDPVAAANGTQPTAVVEVRADGKKPKVYQLPLEGDMHVQDAIDKARVRRKFRRMNVSVLRTSPEGRRHKMDCDYESMKKRVAPQYDYALQPGDYIVISEDTSTIVDDVVAQAVKPLGFLNH